ncbi:transcriptional regulator, LacI family [Tenacibaculum sp. MAR_2009_124]|uniref:LacI family DNA-binding transcriptional regulator n=1 Tax=Tenacibaculum sp. MAR_2009_124 TaxID=1250059 RepID=UPI000895EFE5|nr:LacI family DNA-binding transcriptional regulator [Tenacibaculum sp. MAR_2009_124]SEC19775.1 transcriptional regulator, LacI family [Tenacibaculum sp. MAR_2009_124]
MSNKITLKSIAKELNLSVATVSKALKDYKDISEDTKQKVLDYAAKFKYKPNSFAQSLRSNESRIIGLIIPEIVHHFFSNIINGVIITARKKGYFVLVMPSEESYEDEVNQIKLLTGKNVDGILVSLSNDTINYSHIKQVINSGVPVVLYDRISKLISASKVQIDDIQAAIKATEHLINIGCQKIAHIRGPLKPQTTIDRAKGYRQALQDNNMTFDKSLVYNAENMSYENGYNLAELILKEHPDVDGIFCFTDLVAMGALKKLNELGVRVPEQISIVGFSNWFITQTSSPTLTTINQPGFLIGQEACNILIEEIHAKRDNKPFEHKTIKIPTELVIRESTK